MESAGAKPKRQPYKSSLDRRAEIAAAAMRCLERDGYAKLTARSVALEAGLALGHITYHFRDMHELLSEAYQQASAHLGAMSNEALAMVGHDAWARLGAFLGAGFTEQVMTPGYIRLRIDLWSAALTHPDIAATETALYNAYRHRLTDLLEDASGAPASQIEPVADAIMAMLDGLWLDWMRRQNWPAVRNGLEACMRLARTLTPGP